MTVVLILCGRKKLHMRFIDTQRFVIQFRNPSLWGVLLLSIMTTFSAGCAIKGKNVSVPYAFEMSSHKPEQVDTVIVLPVLDSRIDKSLKINSAKRIQGTIDQFLTKNGYEVVVLKDEALLKPIVPQNLSLPTPEWLASLGPEGSRWVMLIELTETRYTREPASWVSVLYAGMYWHFRTTSVQLTAYLFDKQNLTRPWKKRVVSFCGTTESAFTLMIYSKEDRLMLEDAVKQVVIDMPTRNVKKRPRS